MAKRWTDKECALLLARIGLEPTLAVARAISAADGHERSTGACLAKAAALGVKVGARRDLVDQAARLAAWTDKVRVIRSPLVDLAKLPAGFYSSGVEFRPLTRRFST